MAADRAFSPRRVVGAILAKANENKGNLVGGNFSHFGGKNGASDWLGGPTAYLGKQKSDDHSLADVGDKHKPGSNDVYGRTPSEQKAGGRNNVSGYSGESPAEETARGARLKVSENVTVLGEKSKGKGAGRFPIDAPTRKSVKGI